MFVFPCGGAGKISVGNTSRQVHVGDAIVLAGAGKPDLTANGSGELVFSSFSVSLEHLFPLFASHELTMLAGVTDELKSPRFYDASSSVALECHRLLSEMPPHFSLDHRGQLLRVAASMLSPEFKREHAARSSFVGIEQHMSQVFEKLTFEEILELSVDSLAAKFGCSRRHLNRLFHQYLGLSVASLRMEMRLLRAVSLLRDPGAKVIHVAEQCGFNHLGLFNTCFKRRFGLSPGQWRKSQEGTEAKQSSSEENAPDCRLRTMGLCPWCSEHAGGVGPSGLRFVQAGAGGCNSSASLPPHGNGRVDPSEFGGQGNGRAQCSNRP